LCLTTCNRRVTVYSVGFGPRTWGRRTWEVPSRRVGPRHENQGASHEECAHEYATSGQYLRPHPSARPVVVWPRFGECRALRRVPGPRSPVRHCCRRTRSRGAGGVDYVRQCRATGPHGWPRAGSPPTSPCVRTTKLAACAVTAAPAAAVVRANQLLSPDVAAIGTVGRGVAHRRVGGLMHPCQPSNSPCG